MLDIYIKMAGDNINEDPPGECGGDKCTCDCENCKCKPEKEMK